LAHPQQSPGPKPAAERQRHIADEAVPEPVPEQPEIKPPVTDTGLPVEDQIEKEWDPNKDGGLPTLLPASR
jgi:hypothetical protein